MIDLPLVSLDLELVGAGDDAEIIEIGAVKFRGSEVLGELQLLVRPARPLSHRIGELTGLKSEDFRDAATLPLALEELSGFVGSVAVVGQSIGHDVGHLKRAGLELSNPQLDTFELAMLMRPGLAAYDLQSVARELGVAGAAPHRALADARLARDVFLALFGEAAALEIDVLAHIERLAGRLNWPLRLVFDEAYRSRMQLLFGSGAPAERAQVAGTLVPRPYSPPTDRLQPRESVERLDPDEIAAQLRLGGALARALPEFEEREEQQTMAVAVAETLNEGGLLIVEAGTGTGKSLAYLLPALAFAVANGRRVVVSTNTINLQDQLRDKDVPDILASTEIEARVTVLKGRTNYLCIRRWFGLLRSDDLSVGERMLLIKTLLWLPRTRTGDRAELRLSGPEDEAWDRVAATAESCSLARCEFHREGSCWVSRARRQAEEAHLVIVNHSLLLADLMTGSQVLPEYEYLIVDEAHHLEDEATAQLGRRVTYRELQRRLERLSEPGDRGGLLGETLAALSAVAARDDADSIDRVVAETDRTVKRLGQELRQACSMVEQFARANAKPGDGSQLALRVTPASRAQPVWSDIDVAWGEAGRHVLQVEAALAALIAKAEPFATRGEQVADAIGGLADALAFWSSARALVNQVVAEPDESVVAWLTAGQNDDVGFSAAPLDVSGMLRDELFQPRQAVVLTSATLTVQGSFEFIRHRLGLDDARELSVGSPFHYSTASLVYVPSDSPEPYQPGYQQSVERIVLDVATELNGRTLVLFTSYNQLRATYSALREPLDERKVVLLGQRMDGSSRARLLETFKSGGPCVLMGTSSFWEGIDVVGQALSCLVMARLPFAPPTDPVVEARAEQYEDPFRQYTLPQAALRFRQGFGRLIRSKTDRGVMIVLDARIRTRGYRWAFLRSLPPCPVKTGPAGQAARIAREWVEGRIKL